MTIRQKILKAFYPLVMRSGKVFRSGTGIQTNEHLVKPLNSFYDLSSTANNNQLLSFIHFKGKKVLIVNIASDCGYTGQLNELQKLHELYNSKLVIIAFPANDFKEQEKGTDDEIASFCQLNYGVQFVINKKSTVIKTSEQNNVYKWLTNKQNNGWNEQAPEWNFSKYLVNEQGVLTHYFGPAVSPLSKDVLQNL